MTFIPAAADQDLDEVLDALSHTIPVEVEITVTGTQDILAAKAGCRAALVGCHLRSSGDANTIQFTSGASSTDLSGPFVVDNGEIFARVPNDRQFIVSAVGEKLTLDVVIAAGALKGFVQVIYFKERTRT